MLGGPPSRRPRPSGGSPHPPPPRAALPLTRLQPSAPRLPQRLSLGPGSQLQFARSAAAAQTAAPAAAAAMARALGPYVTSACPSTTPPPPPPAETSPATRGSGGTRRGRPGTPPSGRARFACRAGVPGVPSYLGTPVSVPGPAPSRCQP